MKKTFLGILSVAAIAVAVSSCKKEEQVPLPEGTATVSGRLTANLDATSIINQPVPEGTGVTFIIDGADLDIKPDPTYNYEKVTVRGTADANGRYSVNLPARQTPINVQIVFDDFEFDATIVTTDDNGFQTTTTARKVFTSPNANITIVDGQVEVLDRTYNVESNEFTNSAIIKGMIDGVFIDNVGEVTTTNGVNQGTGYATGTNIAVNGGSGSGLTVNITSVDAGGEILAFNVNNDGTGYTIGDVVTVAGGGSNATFEITGVTPEEGPVPAGVVLTFVTNNGTGTEFKTTTDANGEYMIQVPVNGTDNIQVRFADFENSSVYWEGGNFVTGDKIYSRANATVAVANDNILERDYTYGRTN